MERESDGDDVSAGGRDCVRLEREEIAMGCGTVAMEKSENWVLRD
jgi:hypothetical protein